MTAAELNALFPTRATLIAESGIVRTETEAFIPWACVLAAPAATLDTVIPGWRVIENVQALPGVLLETEEAQTS